VSESLHHELSLYTWYDNVLTGMQAAWTVADM
jgi:hypothetical protein